MIGYTLDFRTILVDAIMSVRCFFGAIRWMCLRSDHLFICRRLQGLRTDGFVPLRKEIVKCTVQSC